MRKISKIDADKIISNEEMCPLDIDKNKEIAIAMFIPKNIINIFT